MRGIAVNTVRMPVAYSVVAIIFLNPFLFVFRIFSRVAWVWGGHTVGAWPDVSSLAWDSEPVASVGENVFADLVVLGLAPCFTGFNEVAVVFHDLGSHYGCCRG